MLSFLIRPRSLICIEWSRYARSPGDMERGKTPKPTTQTGDAWKNR